MRLEVIKELFPNIEHQTYIRLEIFANELIKFNKTINLISPNTESKIDLIHFADSMLGSAIVREAISETVPLYDLGSGNGFPGLVFAIMYPKVEVIMVERDLRKTEFMKHVADLCKLTNVTVLNQEIKHIHSGTVQQAMARGLAPIPRALLHFRSIFSYGGIFLHFKSDSWAKEVADIPSQAFSVWECKLLDTYKIPKLGIQQAIVITERI